MNYKKLNRKVHYWGAITCSIPLLIVTITGILLLLKKEFDWIQPQSMKGSSTIPSITFDQIMLELQSIKQLKIQGWHQIKKIDVRPKKGLLKIQLKNNWEIQIDHSTGKVLQIQFRRSDIIESIHDGSFFHQYTKLWLFLPAAIILFILWVTGIYLFIITEISKRRSKKKNKPLNNKVMT